MRKREGEEEKQYYMYTSMNGKILGLEEWQTADDQVKIFVFA